jgi:heptose-I-phosphate ethanolaminephosphotransferase
MSFSSNNQGRFLVLLGCSLGASVAAFFYERELYHPSIATGNAFVLLTFALSGTALIFLGGLRLAMFWIAMLASLAAPPIFIHSLNPDILLFYVLFTTAISLFIGFACQKRFAALGLTSCFALSILVPENILTAYTLITNSFIGVEQTNVILETNAQEALSYLILHFSRLLPLIAFTIGACGLLLAASYKLKIKSTPPRYVVALLSAIIALTGAAGITEAGASRLHNLFLFQVVQAENAATLKVSQERKLNLNQIGGQLTDPQKAIYIVVIGESANRNHLHIYGYFRETTPYLDALKEKELVAFRNVISSYCMTSASLRRALTLATVDSNKEYRDNGMYSIIEILRSAGFKTYWVTNQLEEGQIPIIASNSDEVFPLPDAQQSLDESLLSMIDVLLNHMEGPSVIFVHLVGSHYPYEARYPLSFKKFDGDKLTSFGPRVPISDINHYDNSIVYTDYVLNSLIDKLKQKNMISSLLYFSDHGESPYIGAGHDPGLFSIGHVEIPLIIWFSQLYRERYANIVKAAEKNRDGAFMADRLSQVIMTWTHVQAPFYQPERSLLTEQFSPSPRWTLDGRINYDDLKDDYATVTKKQTGFDLNSRP